MARSSHQRLRAAEIGEEVADLPIGQRILPRGIEPRVGSPVQGTLEAPAAAGASRPVIPRGEQAFAHEREAGAHHLLDLTLPERGVLAVAAAEDQDWVVLVGGEAGEGAAAHRRDEVILAAFANLGVRANKVCCANHAVRDETHIVECRATE